MKFARNSEFHINPKPIAGYILTAAAGLVYMFYYDMKFGLPFMTVLVLAPVISYILIKTSAGRISADILLSHDTVYKGETVDVTVTVKSEGLFPVPFLYLEFFGGENLTLLGSNKYVLSLSRNKDEAVTQRFKADIWGNAPVGISDISMLDYLGLFKIRLLPDGPQSSLIKNINICPAVYESQTNEFMAFVYNEIICEEEEEERQDINRSFLSEPGYEHRPYVPGDALKRINWKLSAKLDKYMVREYEPLGMNVPVVLLDCRGLRGDFMPVNERKTAAILEERTVEAVLAMLMSMQKQNIACVARCFFEGKWQEFAIGDKEDIFSLQYALAKYKFKSPAEPTGVSRIPSDIVGGGSTIIFTCTLDSELLNELSEKKNNGAPVNVVYSGSSPCDACENMWTVNENYDFYAK